eukprot:COSAG02_NODE_75_length_41389_cov_106.665762_45_plen_59_part_00
MQPGLRIGVSELFDSNTISLQLYTWRHRARGATPTRARRSAGVRQHPPHRVIQRYYCQ